MFGEDGIYGVKFEGQLKFILNAAMYPPVGVDYPMTILERAAFYWIQIARKQAYHNGNKSTALLVMLTYLDANGYELNEYSLEKKTAKYTYETTVDIANNKLNEEDVYKLLFEHSKMICVSILYDTWISIDLGFGTGG